MKKLWIVNHSAIPPELGGLNRHYYFSKYLSRMGYDVRIITASAIHNTNINIIGRHEKSIIKDQKFGDVVYTFLKTRGYHGNGLSRIINFIQFPLRLVLHHHKLGRPDAIYTSSPSPFAAFAAIWLAKKLKIPVVLEVRDLWPETIVVLKKIPSSNPIIWLMYKMEKWMYKNSDRIVFTFEGGVQYIRDKKWDNIDFSKIYYINNGVDSEEYKDNIGIPVEDAELLDLSTFKVAYAGSIRLAYGLETLIDAAQILQPYGDIRFFIWGEGDFKTALEQKCIRNNITNVTFKGFVPKRLIPSLLSKVDANVILLDSAYDGTLARYGCSHNKLFDYLASGRPVIMNYSPNYNLLERYQCGIVSENPSAQSLAEAILRIYNTTREEYMRMKENAQKAVSDFDYRILSEKFRDVVEGVLNQQAKRADD